MIIKRNFFVITGGPGAGKTTLIEALRHAGYHCVTEAGRTIIRQQLASGGNALPWGNRDAFARQMFERSVADYEANQTLGTPVFFDRGIPDVTGYIRLCGLALPPDISSANEQWRYNPVVFIAPPWEEIFSNDAERKQTYAEAVATANMMTDVYSALGYQLKTLPRSSVEQRIAFILAELAGY